MRLLFAGLGLLNVWLFCCGFSAADLSQIESAFIRQDDKEVRILAEPLLAAQSQDLNIWRGRYYLGLIYLRAGENAKASAVLQALDSEVKDALLREQVDLAMVDLNYSEEKYEAALAGIEKCLAAHPQSDALSLYFYRKARIDLKLGRWEDGRVLLSKITLDFPKSFESEYAAELLKEEPFFSIQSGSFTERARSEQLLSEMKSKNLKPYISEMADNGKRYFRVRVGKFSTLNEARQAQEQIKSLGYPSKIYP
ncbi:MAG: SPOR domain-containing protein [Candidatus Omnitrophica bacterium]|nr:SPOR domain-containing protein [Candidatus Omnitrophota bacterium]